MNKEILWNLVDSALAGALVLLGSFINGDVTGKSIVIGIVAAGIVAITKFKDFWEEEGKRKHIGLFTLFGGSL